MEEKIIPPEKLIKINVTKDDVLLLKTNCIERDEIIKKREDELSEKIGCKVAIIPGRYEPVTIMSKNNNYFKNK